MDDHTDDRPSSSVSLEWQGGFRFDSADSAGHRISVDAPMNEGDSYAGMLPGDLLLTALAACSGIDIVNILTRQRQRITGLEIQTLGRQNPEPPWAWEDIEIRYTLRGIAINERLVSRAIDLSENKYCSIGATISGKARIASSYEIIDDSLAAPQRDESA